MLLFASLKIYLWFMIEITVKNIEKKYGNNRVLPGINFNYCASVWGIAGSNGSGKSTLLKILSGLLKPSSGSALWKIDQTEYIPKTIKPHLGFTAPYVHLYEELTVYENVRFLLDLQKNSNIEDINLLLGRFEASGLSNSLFGNLSTGQQQRVKLAASLIKKPSILMLDEPGANLDKEGKALIENLVHQYRNQNKMVVIASNQADELDLCDEILDLNKL